MKYIDADKLIAEIKRRRTDAKLYDMSDGDALIYDEVLSIIDSLQQEQHEPTCKSCGFYENNCPFIRDTFKPYPNKVCKDYIYSVMKELGQQEVDLNVEFTKWWLQEKAKDYEVTLLYVTYPNVSKKLARHFYELGVNARKEK